MNNNKNFFCLKETKLNHVQATEGKCSKLPLPFLSNLALQALIIKVMHGASVIQFFILSPSHRHAGFYKPTLERYSPFLLLTSISLLPFLINFVKFSTLHWQKQVTVLMLSQKHFHWRTFITTQLSSFYIFILIV